MTPGEVERMQAQHDAAERWINELPVRGAVAPSYLEAHADRAALLTDRATLLTDRTRLEALVRELRGTLEDAAYAFHVSDGHSAHALLEQCPHWRCGRHRGVLALAPDATPEGKGG